MHASTHMCACVSACIHLFPESPGPSTGQAALLIQSLLGLLSCWARTVFLTRSYFLPLSPPPGPPALFDLLFSFTYACRLFPVLPSNSHLSDSNQHTPSAVHPTPKNPKTVLIHYCPCRTPDISPSRVLPTVTMT